MEELYSVWLSHNREYIGRDHLGNIKTDVEGTGTYMTQETAQKLCDRLRSKFPNAEAVVMFRHPSREDDPVAASLADLGEDYLGVVKRAIKIAMDNGVTREEVLAAVQSWIGC
jgi:hypothetical protein